MCSVVWYTCIFVYSICIQDPTDRSKPEPSIWSSLRPGGQKWHGENHPPSLDRYPRAATSLPPLDAPRGAGGGEWGGQCSAECAGVRPREGGADGFGEEVRERVEWEGQR